MKKWTVLILFLALLMASPAFALFTNGGFEDGNLSGWQIGYGSRNYGSQSITWGYSSGVAPGIWDAASLMSGQTADIDPYSGSYMARINDSGGGYDATRLSQTDTIDQEDIDAGSMLYVQWGASLVEPSNAHPEGDQPFFGITVSVNGVVQNTFYADALDHDANWTNIGDYGGTIWYRNDVWSYSLASFVLGDSVTIDMFVADCGWGGHGGYAFLDGVGTVRPPDNNNAPVPEPATMLLLGSGLVGLAFKGRKKLLKN